MKPECITQSLEQSMHPDFITHYHLADRKPFLNLSDLEGEELDKVIETLASKRRQDGNFNRVYGRRYMELRKKTEDKLRQLFIEAGGKPQRKSPHYFVLGGAYWFKHLCPNTKEVRIPLSFFKSESVSITYPDSFVSMGFLPEFGLPHDERPYHGKVFKPSDLPALIAEYGMPSDDYRKDYKNYVNEEFEKFIEVQVWDDSPFEWT